MKINDLMHASIFCRNIDAIKDFYENVLGLSPRMVIRNYAYENMPDSPYYNAAKTNPNGICIIYFQVNNSQFIECIATDRQLIKRENWKGYYGLSHIALTVDDIFKTKEELESKNVTIDSLPRLGNSGTWQMWIKDPEGNPIEVMQFTEKSFQLKGHIDSERI